MDKVTNITFHTASHQIVQRIRAFVRDVLCRHSGVLYEREARKVRGSARTAGAVVELTWIGLASGLMLVQGVFSKLMVWCQEIASCCAMSRVATLIALSRAKSL